MTRQFSILLKTSPVLNITCPDFTSRRSNIQTWARSRLASALATQCSSLACAHGRKKQWRVQTGKFTLLKAAEVPVHSENLKQAAQESTIFSALTGMSIFYLESLDFQRCPFDSRSNKKVQRQRLIGRQLHFWTSLPTSKTMITWHRQCYECTNRATVYAG